MISIIQNTMFRSERLKKVIKSKDGIDLKTFDSVKLASEDIGVTRGCMTQICSGYRGKNGFCKGFHWRYADP